MSTIVNEGRLALSYLSDSLRFAQDKEMTFGVWDALGLFPAWRRNLKRPEGMSSLPWLSYPVIRLLETRLTPASTVFEYGSGSSTVFFAQRAGEVVSVEHDEGWAALVEQELHHQRLTNVVYRPVGPDVTPEEGRGDPADPGAYVSANPAYAGCRFQAYAATIDPYPDAYFDLILVDGRVRPSCLKHAVPKLKPTGLLVLDNSHRPHYQRMIRELDGIFPSKQVLGGPTPYARHFTRTTFWSQ